MKMYAEKWARKIVNQWRESSPRVEAMIQTWRQCAREYKCPDPDQYPIERIVQALRVARHSETWLVIKAAVEHEIMWKPLFRKYIIATKDLARYESSDQQYLNYLTYE